MLRPYRAVAVVTAAASRFDRGARRGPGTDRRRGDSRSEEHTSELQSRLHLVCRLLLEKKKNNELSPSDEILSTRNISRSACRRHHRRIRLALAHTCDLEH